VPRYQWRQLASAECPLTHDEANAGTTQRGIFDRKADLARFPSGRMGRGRVASAELGITPLEWLNARFVRRGVPRLRGLHSIEWRICGSRLVSAAKSEQ
jgi:hypothetical protein